MKPKRILIVDDEVSFTRLLKVNLEARTQHTIEVVNRAHEALPAARKQKPDLILLDVIMPGQDGGELAARFQADAGLHDVPVVFLTATVSRTEAAHQGMKSGGFTFLSKPVSMPDLLACLERYLGPTLPKPITPPTSNRLQTADPNHPPIPGGGSNSSATPL
jgi:CheY-like chemotaxis protein